MLTFSDLRHARVNSAWARRLLGRCFRTGEVYRLPFGPLRGARLRYDPSINFHSMLGLWELESVRFLARVFRRGGLVAADGVTCDVGANIGLYALWLGRTVTPGGQVFAFEAAPETFRRLRDTLTLNAVPNVVATQAAVTDRAGPVEFFLGFHHHASSLHQDWAAGEQGRAERIVVAGLTLDDFFGAPNRRPPSFIKMDIEGGAVEALGGAKDLLASTRPLLLIESHNPREDRAVSDVLVRLDYQAYRLNTHSWVRQRDQTHPTPEGVWGTLFLVPAERHAGAVRAI